MPDLFQIIGILEIRAVRRVVALSAKGLADFPEFFSLIRMAFPRPVARLTLDILQFRLRLLGRGEPGGVAGDADRVGRLILLNQGLIRARVGGLLPAGILLGMT